METTKDVFLSSSEELRINGKVSIIKAAAETVSYITTFTETLKADKEFMNNTFLKERKNRHKPFRLRHSPNDCFWVEIIVHTSDFERIFDYIKNLFAKNKLIRIIEKVGKMNVAV